MTRTLVLAAAILAVLGSPAKAEPIAAGSHIDSLRLRNELRDPKGEIFGWDDLEITREGDQLSLRWALTRTDGTIETEEVRAEVRDGFLFPVDLRRTKRDASGALRYALHGTDLTAPEGEATIRITEKGATEIDPITVDDPPLYPSVMAGAVLHALVDGEQGAVEFTTLVEYPWGYGPARLRASVIEDIPARPTILGSVPTRRVHLQALRSWLVDLVIRMIGIRTSVYLDIAFEDPRRPVLRFDGPIAHDSGTLTGHAIAFRALAPGERLETWPPPISGYSADALLQPP